MTVEFLNEIWEILEEKTVNESKSGFLTRRILPDSPHNIFLGFEKPDNVRILLIKITKENVLNMHSLPHTKGLKLRQVILPEDKDRSVTIELVLIDSQYKDIFTTLSEDIVNQCSHKNSEKAMLHAFISRLEMWCQFLDRHGSDGLSEDAQKGLYGELRFLRDFMIPHIGVKKAISAWVGPHKSQQDFQTSGIAVEVKTSSGKLHQKIHVASEQQLDDSGLDALYVFYLSLRELHDGGETLSSIIDEIREICGSFPGITADFEELLFHAGYLEDHRNKYEEKGYAFRSSYIFLVNEGFPRITENKLISGVGDVHYSIILSSCMPFIVSEEEFRLSIKGEL